jgi:hypothetical protein
MFLNKKIDLFFKAFNFIFITYIVLFDFDNILIKISCLIILDILFIIIYKIMNNKLKEESKKI